MQPKDDQKVIWECLPCCSAYFGGILKLGTCLYGVRKLVENELGFFVCLLDNMVVET